MYVCVYSAMASCLPQILGVFILLYFSLIKANVVCYIMVKICLSQELNCHCQCLSKASSLSFVLRHNKSRSRICNLYLRIFISSSFKFSVLCVTESAFATFFYYYRYPQFIICFRNALCRCSLWKCCNNSKEQSNSVKGRIAVVSPPAPRLHSPGGSSNLKLHVFPRVSIF